MKEKNVFHKYYFFCIYTVYISLINKILTNCPVIFLLKDTFFKLSIAKNIRYIFHKLFKKVIKDKN